MPVILTMGDTPQHNAAISEDGMIRRLIKLVTDLDLDRHDFVIFGSGPMLAHGLRQSIRDLDIVARGTTWDRISSRGTHVTGSINGAPMVSFCDGLIQFSQGWVSDDWKADDLIERAEIIDGLPFAQLADVLAYKLALFRPKDEPDIVMLLQALGHADRTRSLKPSRATL